MDVLASGYPSLDFIIPVSHSPAVGQTALMQASPDDQMATFGGCGANVAVGLRRLGFWTGVGMIIGDDPRGFQYSAYLLDEGIDLTNLIVVEGGKTSCSFLFRNPQGEYQNFFYAGAADAWQGTLHLHGLDSLRYGLVTVAAYHYNRQFVELVHAAGVPLIWQLKPDIYAYPAEGMARFAQLSQIILMNYLEADFVLRSLGLRHVSQLLNSVTQVVVVTHGEQAIRVYAAAGEYKIPPVARQLVDSTGAGDGFTAGFIAGLLRGEGLKKCAQMGAVLASFVLEKVGCQTNLPNWDQMWSRYKEYFGE